MKESFKVSGYSDVGIKVTKTLNRQWWKVSSLMKDSCSSARGEGRVSRDKLSVYNTLLNRTQRLYQAVAS